MIWKRLNVLVALPFLLAVAADGQNQQSPNAPGPTGQTLHFNYIDYVRGKNRDANKNIELKDGDVVLVAPVPQASPK